VSEDVPLQSSLAALSSFFVGATTLADTLHRVSELAVSSLEPVAFAGLTLMVDGVPSTAVFTDHESPEIDQTQYETGSGPCLDAYRTGTVCTIASTREANPWPAFSDSCRAHGILSTLSLPMIAVGRTLGAMNLYSPTEHAFVESEIEEALLFAAQAAMVLANAQAYWEARMLSEQLGESIASRAVIEQAKGIIMGALRCTAEQAFDRLVRQSQSTNTKLRDVARQIVEDVTKSFPLEK
jgi:GAF domain-containing protein